MNLALRRSQDFDEDFDLQYRWYLKYADESVADRYLDAVWKTLKFLATQPELARRRQFRNPALRDMRSFRVVSPFEVHLVFYRHNATELSVERLMHGSRDLPRRLVEPPGSN